MGDPMSRWPWQIEDDCDLTDVGVGIPSPDAPQPRLWNATALVRV